MIQIYNSLCKQKIPFKPKVEGKVGMYVCGITVYDYCHLGHARTAMAFDMIYRYLQFCDYEVTYIRNITDIDDKIIQRAQERKISCQDLAQCFTKAMHEDYAALGMLAPTIEPYATAHIEDIIDLITTLIDKKIAYIGDSGDVFFNVNQYSSYGELSHQDLKSLRHGIRVEVDPSKRDALDFVLWKQAKPGEPQWDSPWGAGRPGWHIECSAMATHFLGQPVDIHGGGSDLKFPHHENERAQSEAAYKKTFAHYWIHVGFIQIDNEKMSKSLGNFFTIREVLAQFNAEIIRYFMLASHYRSPVNYTQDSLTQAHASLETLYLSLRNEQKPKQSFDFKQHPFTIAFKKAMDDDFNTPQAISVLFDITKEINRNQHSHPELANQYRELLRYLGGNALGLFQISVDEFFQGKKNPQIRKLVDQRIDARKHKDWEKVDQYRDVLSAHGVVLEDQVEGGTLWREGIYKHYQLTLTNIDKLQVQTIETDKTIIVCAASEDDARRIAARVTGQADWRKKKSATCDDSPKQDYPLYEKAVVLFPEHLSQAWETWVSQFLEQF